MQGFDITTINDFVGIFGMVGHQLNFVAMQGDFTQSAAVGLCEIGHLKITFQNFGLAQETCFDDFVFFQFLLEPIT